MQPRSKNRALIDALARRAKRRKSKPRLKAPRFPRGAEIAYMRSLISLSREVSSLIWEALQPVWSERQDAVDQKPIPTNVTRLLNRLRVEVSANLPAQAQREAGKMVREVEGASRKALNESYKRVIGVEPWKGNETLRGTMAERMRENVRLITSIPTQQLDQVEEVVRAGFASGARVETIQREVRERFQVSESRARLIARDQVGKANAELNEARQRELGVTTYTWESSRDERVRPMHRELDGTRHSWDDPPVTNEDGDRNHPGEDFQCRCNSIADIENVLESLGL